MTIQHFADQQNLVFVPALLALLLATVLICLPIVFAPALRRGGRGRSRATIVLTGVVAAAALVVAGWQAGIGVRTLQNERAQLQSDVRARYGYGLVAGDANELLNGGAPLRRVPSLASAAGLATPTAKHTLRLKVTDPGADTYDLLFGGKTLPVQGA